VKLRTARVTTTLAILHDLSVKAVELVVQLDCDFSGVQMLKGEQIFYLQCTIEFDQLAQVAN
jgi:hypothetical protein